jgi:hypothetical protein
MAAFPHCDTHGRDRDDRTTSIRDVRLLGNVARRVELTHSSRVSGTVGLWRNLHLQAKTAFSRFPPVHRTDVEGQQRVDLTHTPNPPAMSAFCPQRTAGVVKGFGRSRPRPWTPQLGGPLPFPSDAGRQDWAGHLPSPSSERDCWISHSCRESRSTLSRSGYGDYPARRSSPIGVCASALLATSVERRSLGASPRANQLAPQART